MLDFFSLDFAWLYDNALWIIIGSLMTAGMIIVASETFYVDDDNDWL